jgi:hypothetical protein
MAQRGELRSEGVATPAPAHTGQRPAAVDEEIGPRTQSKQRHDPTGISALTPSPLPSPNPLPLAEESWAKGQGSQHAVCSPNGVPMQRNARSTEEARSVNDQLNSK